MIETEEVFVHLKNMKVAPSVDKKLTQKGKFLSLSYSWITLQTTITVSESVNVKKPRIFLKVLVIAALLLSKIEFTLFFLLFCQAMFDLIKYLP